MKEEFLKFIETLMKANPKLTEEIMTDDVRAYLDILSETKKEKPTLTENGKVILKYLQEHPEVRAWKSKDIAEQIGLASRSVSGTMRKLVNDNFCEKIGKDPIIYTLTEKGKNYEIIEGENE